MSKRFCLSLLLILSLPGCAGELPMLSLEDLAARSDSIVEGRIVRAWSGMDPENRFIWTHYEMAAHSTLKGQAGSTITITEPGGTLGGRTLYVPGTTHYAVGEDVAVFLYRTPIGYLRTTNYGQGKFTISNGGLVHVNRAIQLAGAEVSASAFRSSGGTSVQSLEGVGLYTFAARVSRIVKGRGARR
jgi:hypothetical protein